jgi:hypothetical protein
MCRRFRLLRLTFAIALVGLVCLGSAPALLAQSDVDASEDSGAAPAEDGTEVSSEGEAEPGEASPDPDVTVRLGDSRRIDAFDAVDDEGGRMPHPAALAHPGHDVVVCEAGCDKTAGSIVYMQKRQ